jgi:hypothetical protein
MYWVSPFTYLLGGYLGLLLDGVPIRCETNELAIFSPPPGQDCQSYAGQFAQQAGGYVQSQPNGDCGYCQFRDGTTFAASFNVVPRYIWRDFGILCKYRRTHTDRGLQVNILCRHLRRVQLWGGFCLHLAVSRRPTKDQISLQFGGTAAEEGHEAETEWRFCVSWVVSWCWGRVESLGRGAVSGSPISRALPKGE